MKRKVIRKDIYKNLNNKRNKSEFDIKKEKSFHLLQKI